MVHLGAAGNLHTVIRRRLPNGTQSVEVTGSTPRICSNSFYVDYWMCLQGQGQVSVGVGREPGKNCFLTLDDSLYHALRSPIDAVQFVGVGNSALGRHAKDLKVRNVVCSSVPNAGQLELEMVDYSPSLVERPSSSSNPATTMDDDAALWEAYQKECAKAQARAKKYGTEYKAPAPDAFLKWSDARRLRANPERGFITGMDILSPEEVEKAKKRKQRFEEEEERERMKLGGGGERMEDEDEEGWGEVEEESEETKRGAERPMIPLEQAWDNEELVRKFRVDPPSSMYVEKNGVAPAQDRPMDGNGSSDRGEIESDLAMNDENQPVEKEKIALPVPEKIHLFAIDWAAFKQIRTDDIMVSTPTHSFS